MSTLKAPAEITKRTGIYFFLISLRILEQKIVLRHPSVRKELGKRKKTTSTNHKRKPYILYAKASLICFGKTLVPYIYQYIIFVFDFELNERDWHSTYIHIFLHLTWMGKYRWIRCKSFGEFCNILVFLQFSSFFVLYMIQKCWEKPLHTDVVYSIITGNHGHYFNLFEISIRRKFLRFINSHIRNNFP